MLKEIALGLFREVSLRLPPPLARLRNELGEVACNRLGHPTWARGRIDRGRHPVLPGLTFCWVCCRWYWAEDVEVEVVWR